MVVVYYRGFFFPLSRQLLVLQVVILDSLNNFSNILLVIFREEILGDNGQQTKYQGDEGDADSNERNQILGFHGTGETYNVG